MTIRTITLTDRPPVKIDDNNWRIVAVASDSEHDGQVECQANRTRKWWIKVRQHSDGRAIVYAGYDLDTRYQSESDLCIKHGVLLPKKSDDAAICAAIKSVAQTMASNEHYGDDAQQWPRLADECIADMPAEELADSPEDGLVDDAADAAVDANESIAEARCIVATDGQWPIKDHEIVYFPSLREAFAYGETISESRVPHIIEVKCREGIWRCVDTWTPQPQQ